LALLQLPRKLDVTPKFDLQQIIKSLIDSKRTFLTKDTVLLAAEGMRICKL
jgi:hypothetical protein